MINKSVFENDLISGMQRNLASQEGDEAINKLAQAVEFLNSAAEILDEANLTTYADRIVNLLEKIAQMRVKQHSLLDKLNEVGVDIFSPEYSEFKTDKKAKIRLNNALYGVGATEKQIEDFIGKEYAMSKLDVDKWASIYNLKSHHEPKFVDVKRMVDLSDKKPDVYELIIDDEDNSLGQSINLSQASDPRKIKDRHTQNLTSEKMLKNLQHHGTVFNMADDGADKNSAKDLKNEKSEVVNLEDEEDNDLNRLFED